MDRRVMNSLIIGDDELDCDCDKVTIDDLNISHIGFAISVLDKFDFIMYEGKKGTKILKSVYTKTGKVV